MIQVLISVDLECGLKIKLRISSSRERDRLQILINKSLNWTFDKSTLWQSSSLFSVSLKLGQWEFCVTKGLKQKMHLMPTREPGTC